MVFCQILHTVPQEVFQNLPEKVFPTKNANDINFFIFGNNSHKYSVKFLGSNLLYQLYKLIGISALHLVLHRTIFKCGFTKQFPDFVNHEIGFQSIM